MIDLNKHLEFDGPTISSVVLLLELQRKIVEENMILINAPGGVVDRIHLESYKIMIKKEAR